MLSPQVAENRVERTAVKRANDQQLHRRPQHQPDDQSERRRKQRAKTKLGGNQSSVATDGEETAMGEIDDLKHTEDDQQTGGHHKQDGRRRHHVQQQNDQVTSAWDTGRQDRRSRRS